MGIHLKDIIEGVCRSAINDYNGDNIDETYLKKTGDTKDNTATFTSEDAENPNKWSNVDTLENNENHSSIFNKISVMFKNIRWIYKMLGEADISKIGAGTITSAILVINKLLGVKEDISSRTDIEYSYPVGSYVTVSSGAESLNVALKDATQKITEEVCKLNTGIENVSGIKNIYFGTYDHNTTTIDDTIKDIFSKIPLDKYGIIFGTFRNAQTFKIIIQSYQDRNYASAIVFSYAISGIWFYKKVGGIVYKHTADWTEKQV